MLEFKKFVLLPDGNHVTGGEAQYSLDTDKGTLEWSASASVSVFFFSKTLASSGVEKVDPKSLLSASFHVGQVIKIGPVTAVVESIAGGVGTAAVTVEADGIHEVGTAQFDMTKEYVSLIGIAESGTIRGFSINLNLQAE